MAQKPTTLLELSVSLRIEQAAEAELIKNKGVVINVSSGVALAAAPAAAMAPYFIAKASQVGIVHEAFTHWYTWCTLRKQPAWRWPAGRLLAGALHRCAQLQCMQPAGSVLLMNRRNTSASCCACRTL